MLALQGEKGNKSNSRCLRDNNKGTGNGNSRSSASLRMTTAKQKDENREPEAWRPKKGEGWDIRCLI